MPRPRPSQIYRSRPSPKYNLPEGFIISNCANHCPYCHKRLNGPFAVSGHLAYCVTARNSFKGDEVINIINDDDSYLQLLDADDDEGAIDIDIVDYNAYKLIQLHCLSKEKIEFRTGHCLSNLGTMVKGKWRQYLAVCKTLEGISMLEASEADSVINLVKFICEDQGVSVGLPSEYKRIMKTVMKSTSHRALRVHKMWVTPPEFLFNITARKLRKCPFVYYDILAVLSHQLIDERVVGSRGENFALGFEYRSVEGKRVISDFHTAEYFRRGCEWVRENVGPNVKFLPIIISSDKTVISEGTTKVAFPCYASVGNLKLKSMCEDSSTELIGYVPDVMDTNVLIRAQLEEAGCMKSMLDEATTLYRRHLEQEVTLLLLVTCIYILLHTLK
jgi:hypothetical protein